MVFKPPPHCRSGEMTLDGQSASPQVITGYNKLLHMYPIHTHTYTHRKASMLRENEARLENSTGTGWDGQGELP